MSRIPPESVGKTRARRVFGDVVVEDAASNTGTVDTSTRSNSLTYSPSPVGVRKGPIRNDELTRTDAKSVLFGESSSSSSSSIRSDSSGDKENATETSSNSILAIAPPVNVKALSSKTIAVSKSRVENLPEQQKKELRRLRKQSRSPKRRDLVKKTQEAINNATTSVNQSLNAVRRAKTETYEERAKETAKIRDQWREEKEEAKEFYAEAEKNRRELLSLQRQLSSKYVQAKAHRNMEERIAHISAVDQESQFKSEVFRQHKQALKEEQDRKRRHSTEARRKIRQNNRQGEERMRLTRIEEDQALLEERHLSSLAWRTSKRNLAEQRRKSFQFRNGDARRIRELHARMESERVQQEHESFELKLAGERDADAYKKQLAQERRDSFAFRNREGHRQREEEEISRDREQQAVHASYELKWAGERDADAYRKRMEQERRDSFAFRNQEGRRQKQQAEVEKSRTMHDEHENYELKWAGERDGDAYQKRMEKERRDSFAFRNQEGRRQREESERQRSVELHAEHQSFELKMAGERDADAYRRRLVENRRDSYAFRNKEGHRQRLEAELQRSEAQHDEHESYELKWDGERDADAYRKRMEQERRDSFSFRNEAGRRQREQADRERSQALQADHASFELKMDGERDADAYRRQLEQERRDSYAFRNKEGHRQRLEAEVQRSEAQHNEHKSYELKWAGERDADAYQKRMEQERRDSFAFRNREGRRWRQEADQQRSQEFCAEHNSYELKWAAEQDADAYRKKMEQERRDSFKFRNEERVKHAKVMEELRSIAREKETESLMLKWAGENDAKAYLAQLEEERRQSFAFRNQEGKRQRDLAEEEHHQRVQYAHADEALQAACRRDVLEYEAKNAERDRASLVFRRKEANIQRLEEEERRQAEYQVEQENRKLEDAARRDVEEYIKDCKDRRRLSLAFRAKEKRAHAEWERREAERRRAQQSRDTRDRAIDQRHVEAARQKERAKIALNAIRHAGCTFAVNPFAGLLDN